MFSRNQAVYQPTTVNYDQPKTSKGGYLARSSSTGCCYGTKRRRQLLYLFGSLLAIMAGVVLIGAGGTSINGSIAAMVFFIIVGLGMLVGGVFLMLLYLRTTGRCNFAWWPSRAAVLSRTLNEDTRSPTQMTVTSEVVASNPEEESSKLMDEQDSTAEKIGQSDPKIVLKA